MVYSVDINCSNGELTKPPYGQLPKIPKVVEKCECDKGKKEGENGGTI